MIEKPLHKKYTITNDDIWDILILTETQGGDKAKAHGINKILEAVVARHSE